MPVGWPLTNVTTRVASFESISMRPTNRPMIANAVTSSEIARNLPTHTRAPDPNCIYHSCRQSSEATTLHVQVYGAPLHSTHNPSDVETSTNRHEICRVPFVYTADTST